MLRTVGSRPTPQVLLRLFARSGLISAGILFVGAIYTLYAISEPAVENTRMSENALLSGLVDENFRDSAQILRQVKELAKHIKNKAMLRDYIFKEFERMGIEVFRHKYETVPSAFIRANSSTRRGENVYGIVRAFRATPAEAILLAVPMRLTHADSIAIALALAGYVKEQIYWARDIIFLFVDGGDKLAAEAWLAAYHGYAHPWFSQANESDGDLPAHGGAIIGAVALDLIGSVFTQVNVQFGMVNGKLPNLDLVNLFVLLIEKAGTNPSIYNVQHHRRLGLARQHYSYSKATLTIARSIASQSFLEHESITSVFGSYGLNAVTLHVRKTSNSERLNEGTGVLNALDIARILEGGLRSLNNVLEKLHQSYFLYLMPHPHKFISVAFYMPLIGFLASPLVVFGLREWLKMGGVSGISLDPLRLLLTSHLIALTFYAIQYFLYTKSGSSSQWDLLRQFDAKYIASLSILYSTLPLYLIGRIKFRDSKSPSSHFHCARFFIAIELALFLVPLSLLHFPLAVALSLLLLPMALLTFSIERNTPFWRRITGFVIFNPFAIALFLCVLLHNFGVYKVLETGVPNGWAKCVDGTESFLPCVFDRLGRLWSRLITFVALIAFNHFANGSALLPILSVPVFAIYTALTQIHFSHNKY